MWLLILPALVAILGMLYQHASHSLSELRNNFIAYRCSPGYLPFVSLIRPDIDTSTNFSYCISVWGNELLKPIMDVLNSLFAVLGSALGEITGPLGIFRSVFANLRGFIFSFMATTMGKAANSSSVFIHYLIKIRDMLQRFVGQGYIASFLAYVGISFIESFVTLCINVIKTFVYVMLAIAVVLALFQPEILAIVLVIASLLAAAGA